MKHRADRKVREAGSWHRLCASCPSCLRLRTFDVGASATSKATTPAYRIGWRTRAGPPETRRRFTVGASLHFVVAHDSLPRKSIAGRSVGILLVHVDSASGGGRPRIESVFKRELLQAAALVGP